MKILLIKCLRPSIRQCTIERSENTEPNPFTRQMSKLRLRVMKYSVRKQQSWESKPALPVSWETECHRNKKPQNKNKNKKPKILESNETRF